MSRKMIDLTGQKFNHLTVLKFDEEKSLKNKYWICKCDCGTIKSVQSGHLKNGSITNCGCLNKNNYMDLTGQTFGRLTVLERDYLYNKNNNLKNKSIYWKCKCSCGSFTTVSGKNLFNGSVYSCGCYHREIIEKNKRNIQGLRFGKLIALKPTEERSANRTVKWLCQCDCGNTTIADVAKLLNGDIQSCGCLVSKGEAKIAFLLKENNYKYVNQKTFSDCLSPNGYKLKFDFFVEDKFLVEFDGKQHFYYTNEGWNNQENFEKIILNDDIKNKWCKEKKIPLKRIPYWKLETLTIEDIIGDSFLIT